MKKHLHTLAALFLIALGIWGCTLHRSRPLRTCFPTDDWTAVSGAHLLPGEGADGELDITPEALKEAVDNVSVRPRSAFPGWDCETVSLRIEAEGHTISAEVGENGTITIAEYPDPEGSRSYWQITAGTLYQPLLDACD